MGRKKQGEVQRAEPGIGDNFKKRELTEDEKRVLLYSFKAKCAEHDRKIAKTQSILTNAKAAKKSTLELAKSEYGVDAKADIEELMILELPGAGEALKIEIERKLRLARYANVPEGFQASMFEPDRRPDTERARELGKTAALAGEVCKPPYDPSVPQYKEWIEGYHLGQAVFCAILKPDDERQMDFAERDDMPPVGQPNTADVSAPPFMPPPDMPDTPDFLRREA
jgi:hypothetical protein